MIHKEIQDRINAPVEPGAGIFSGPYREYRNDPFTRACRRVRPVLRPAIRIIRAIQGVWYRIRRRRDSGGIG